MVARRTGIARPAAGPQIAKWSRVIKEAGIRLD
jgi:hypothetical protein